MAETGRVGVKFPLFSLDPAGRGAPSSSTRTSKGNHFRNMLGMGNQSYLLARPQANGGGRLSASAQGEPIGIPHSSWERSQLRSLNSRREPPQRTSVVSSPARWLGSEHTSSRAAQATNRD